MTQADYHRVWDIHAMLTPKPDELLNSNRFYIREGELYVWDEKKRAKKKRYAFLFNDVMLLTKKEGPKKYWLRVYITLRSPYVQVEDVSSGFAYVFRLHCRTRSFTFFTATADLNSSWIEDIRDSATGAHDKRALQAKQEVEKSPFDSGTKLEALKPITTEQDEVVPVLAPPPQRARSVSKGRTSSVIMSPSASSSVNSSSTTSSNLLNDILDFDYDKQLKQKQQQQPQPQSQPQPQPQPFLQQPQPQVQAQLQSVQMQQPQALPTQQPQPMMAMQQNPVQPALVSNPFMNPTPTPNPLLAASFAPPTPAGNPFTTPYVQPMGLVPTQNPFGAAPQAGYMPQQPMGVVNPFMSPQLQTPQTSFGYGNVGMGMQPTMNMQPQSQPQPSQQKPASTPLADDPFSSLYSTAKQMPSATTTSQTNGFDSSNKAQQSTATGAKTPSSTFDLLM